MKLSYVQVEIETGVTFDAAVKRAQDFSKIINCEVGFSFNDQQIYVNEKGLINA